MAMLAESPRLRAGLVLLLVFGAGLALGLTIARRPPPHRPPGPPFLAELELTPEQHAAMQVVLERHRPELEAVLRDSQPKVASIQAKVEAELDAILTPAQLERVRAMKADGRLPPPGFPPGGPPGAPPFGPPDGARPPPPGGPGAELPPPP